MNTYEILGIGSPIVDYIIPIDEEDLRQLPGKKGGMEPVDFDTLQDLLRSSKKTPVITTGGSCSNTIKGLTHLGYRCALAGVIGSDDIANQYMRFVKNRGITPLFQVSEKQTSQVVCFVTPDGERTCRAFLGASQDMRLEQIRPEFFENVQLVHIEGYSLLQGVLTEKVMQLAKAAGCKISFDLASFELVEQYKERIMSLLSRFVDIAFANDHEIETLTGVGGAKGCQYLKDISETAIVKQSNKGCWVGQNTYLVHQPAFEANVVDSTGAGDLFASGFLAAYLKGKSLEECALLGNLAGAAAVEVHGTDVPQEKWDSIQSKL